MTTVGDTDTTGRSPTGGVPPLGQLPRARWIAIASYTITAIASLVLGTIYLTSSTFLPYHRDAMGADWDTLDTGAQVVLRALVHVGGAGWLACAIALISLTWIPLRRGERWAAIITPVVGLAFWIPNVWATVEVSALTEGSPPWYASAFTVVLLVVGAASSAVEDLRLAPPRSGPPDSS